LRSAALCNVLCMHECTALACVRLSPYSHATCSCLFVASRPRATPPPLRLLLRALVPSDGTSSPQQVFYESTCVSGACSHSYIDAARVKSVRGHFVVVIAPPVGVKTCPAEALTPSQNTKKKRLRQGAPESPNACDRESLGPLQQRARVAAGWGCGEGCSVRVGSRFPPPLLHSRASTLTSLFPRLTFSAVDRSCRNASRSG
jgi:hypothetical protein